MLDLLRELFDLYRLWIPGILVGFLVNQFDIKGKIIDLLSLSENVIEIPAYETEFLSLDIKAPNVYYRSVFEYVNHKGLVKANKQTYLISNETDSISEIINHPSGKMFSGNIAIEFLFDVVKKEFDKKKSFKVIFSSRRSSINEIRNLIDEIREWYDINCLPFEKKKTTLFYNHGKHGTWKKGTVMLPIKGSCLDDTTKQLFDDIDRFRESRFRNTCIKLGKTWKRGYLLYGKPGCGKTTAIKNLSFKYGMSVFNVDFSILKDTSSLVDTFNEVPNHSIICLEDIDEMLKKLTDENKISYVLNFLDGFSSKEVIVIMTTNNIENLPDKLIRKGRIDKQIQFSYCTTEQITRLFEETFKTKLNLDENFRNDITVAEVSDIIFNNLLNPDKAEELLKVSQPLSEDDK